MERADFYRPLGAPSRLTSCLVALGMGALVACGGSDRNDDAPIEVVDYEGPQRVPVRFDALLYGDGDEATVEVRLDGVSLSGELGSVVVVTTETRDAELLALEPGDAAGTYRTAALPVRVGGTTSPDDGTIVGRAGEPLVALYFVDPSAFGGVDTIEDLSYDVAALAGEGDLPESDVVAEVALTDDEDLLAAAGRPTGTLVSENGPPVQLATRELIVVPRDEEELARVLDEVGGEVLAGPMPTGEAGDAEAFLVSAEPSEDDLALLPYHRALLGEEDTLLASREDALAIYGLAARLRLEGLAVAVNPRLQWQGEPRNEEQPGATLAHTMQSLPAPTAAEGDCLPHDPARTCWTDVPAVWAHMALFGFQSRSIPVAVLDMGFAPNADFRGPIHQCDMTPLGAPVCGAGAAEGSPTVGNSFFGERSWHGTGVATTIAGVVNDGFGAPGVGGQVARPMLYKYDLGAYAFDIGGGIRKAVDDGAAVINVSAGYPCRVLTSVGPDLEICDPRGRAGTCAALGATAAAGAGIACGVFPFACPFIAAAVTAATESCLASLAFGDARSPMMGAVYHAAREGVPVVASAGNTIPRESLPPVVRDYVALGNDSSDDWGIVPATLPYVISVGALDESGRSIELNGDTVDVWAPTFSSYFAPERVDDPSSPLVQESLGGTSGAAPFVAGLIAAMQAANRELDPTVATHSAVERRAIVQRITSLITENGRTDADMVALGFDSQPARRVAIDPLATIEAASADHRVDLGALGFLESYGFEERFGDDDTPDRARELDVPFPREGNLVQLTRSGASMSVPDLDYVRVTAPDMAAEYVRTQVTIRSAGASGGRAIFSHPRMRLVASAGGATTYELVLRTPEAVAAPIEGFGRAYRVSRTPFEPIDPEVRIVSPVVGDTICAGDVVLLEGEAGFEGHAAVPVRGAGLSWSVDGVARPSGFSSSFVPTLGEHTIRLAYGSSVDTLSVVAEDCIGTAPTVSITSPGESGAVDVEAWAEDHDGNGWYVTVTLRASVSDPDEVIAGSAIEWSTGNARFQPGGPTSGRQVLGTGRVLTTRLYTSCGDGASGLVDHDIEVTVVDSDGLRATSSANARVIRVRLLC